MSLLPLKILTNPTRYIFFTGKGGVGKTALSCAVALALAETGRKVLLVSTDPASNLDEMLECHLASTPTAVPGIARLSALNIDPQAAADAYRQRVLGAMTGASAADKEKVREQLSGACTTEIAAFDQFAGLLADEDSESASYDHIIFDTAPTGHTLRLLSLPKAWSSFLETNENGASCLGPHSGLQMQLSVFEKALAALNDPSMTTIALVTRPEASALREAARSAGELRALGLNNQHLLVNAVYRATDPADKIAQAFELRCNAALEHMPAPLRALTRNDIPMRAYDMVGLEALRNLIRREQPTLAATRSDTRPREPGLRVLIDEIEASGNGLVMVMGKGGVGKTTMAGAVAAELARRGHQVLLTTTDPAAHVEWVTRGERLTNLTVSRIDPAVETQAYIDRIMETRGGKLDAAGKALLLEDLRSPCTEEVAVFHAFSRIVTKGRSGFVVIDTAPTGHTFLLLDATGAYHRQVMRDFHQTGASGRAVTTLMRLQDQKYTKILLVALPETTPISEAAALQEDLRRAKIEPFAWIINNCLSLTGTADPLLRFKMGGEAKQIARVHDGLAQRIALVPWQAEAPTGIEGLGRLVR